MKTRSSSELEISEIEPKEGKYNFDDNGSIPKKEVYRRYCPESPQKYHRFYMYKPVNRYTWSEENGTMHQMVYCRYCTESFESVLRVEKDKNGLFRTIREIRKVETIIHEENEPRIESQKGLNEDKKV